MKKSLGNKIFSYRVLSIITLSFIFITMLFLTGCDKRTVDENRIQISSMMTSGSTLYEDNGATFVTVSVTVKDNNGFPVAGQMVNFKASAEQIGILPARAYTDSSGIAKADVFVNSAIIPAGMTYYAVKVESYLGTKFQKSVDLQVQSSPDVNVINLDPIPAALSINQEILIKARPFGVNNQPITDGTKVTFVATGGYFIDEYLSAFEGQFQAAVKNGVATVKFRAGTNSTSINVNAEIGSVSSDTLDFMVLPGSPKLMTLVPFKAQTDTIVNDVSINGQSVEIHADLSDEWGNVIPGRIINYTTTLGNITPNASTDLQGHAKVMFNPGSIAGNATITATSDSATAIIMISVTSDEVQFLRFTNEGTINLNVAGSGGIESQTLSVKLFDTSGNLVTSQKTIRFELKSKPDNTTINNSPNEVNVQSYGGIASVSINSGNKSGIAVLRATLMNDDGSPTPIYVEQGRIIIHAGKPHSVAFTIGGNDSGFDLGAGNWRVNVSAIIRDLWGNPVDKGTGVYFSILDPTIYSDSVTIVAPAFVGNISASGDSAAGTAYTVMVYHGSLSNTKVNVSAEIGQTNSDSTNAATAILTLPMQNINIEVVPNPQHVDWTATSNPDTKNATIITKVIDGQGNLLRNVPLQFYISRGTFIDMDIPLENPSDNNPVTGITANNGINIKTVKFYQYECPEPSPAGPGETSGTVTVTVLGTGKTGTTDFILRRYVPGE